ncbi:hypothetical protein FDP41_004675 [Naegleria fowleri]|uniref:FHA domain-containing protein n=1 Tax=Naegleria fowleri TaxID=5763 RepID=A0A6A5BPY5_NAEFO|nr:uncharacterized protein FDP41_004675 [Naegleria fowleri]KAF0976301.1 hypothetical protein FDP41_004675 [Naegleria fowleri]
MGATVSSSSSSASVSTSSSWCPHSSMPKGESKRLNEGKTFIQPSAVLTRDSLEQTTTNAEECESCPSGDHHPHHHSQLRKRTAVIVSTEKSFTSHHLHRSLSSSVLLICLDRRRKKKKTYEHEFQRHANRQYPDPQETKHPHTHLRHCHVSSMKEVLINNKFLVNGQEFALTESQPFAILPKTSLLNPDIQIVISGPTFEPAFLSPFSIKVEEERKEKKRTLRDAKMKI